MNNKSMKNLTSAFNKASNYTDNCAYPEKAYFMGHSGTHVKDGIYKIDEPYRAIPCVAFNIDYINYAILYDGIDDESYGVVEYFKHCLDGNDFSTLYEFNRDVLNKQYGIKKPSVHRGEIY